MASLPTLIKASTSLFLVILLLNSPSCTEAENILYPGESLKTDEFLSYGCDYKLRMQGDCNLVLYDGDNAVWHSNTARRGKDCRCSVDKEGNIVINSSSGKVWSSGSPGCKEGNYVLVLQKDRNLVVYGPTTWASKTNKAQIAQVTA